MAQRYAYGDVLPYRPAPGPDYGGRGGGSIVDLIMRGGDMQARAALEGANSWGNAFQSIGQTVAGALQQRAEQKEIAKRDASYMDFIRSGKWKDPQQAAEFIFSTFGPTDEAQRQLQGISGLYQLTQPKRDPGADLKAAEGVVRGLSGLMPEARATLWAPARGMVLQALGQSDPERAAKLEQLVSPEYSEDSWQIVTGMLNTEQGKTRQIEVRNPDGSTSIQIVEDRPGQTFSSAPPQEGKIVTTVGPDGRPVQRMATPEELAAGVPVYEPPRGSGSEPRPLTQTAEAGLIARWAKEYDTATKPARDLSRALSMMDAGLKAAKAGDLNAGSQAVLVTFQKLLDPTSVVRESEYARSAEGMALMDRIAGAYQRLTQGGPGVPVKELEEFARVGRQFVDGYNYYGKGVKARIGKAADRYNIPHELIFSDYGGSASPVAPPAAQAAPPAASGASTPQRPPGVPPNAQWDPQRRRWVL